MLTLLTQTLKYLFSVFTFTHSLLAVFLYSNSVLVGQVKSGTDCGVIVFVSTGISHTWKIDFARVS